MRIIGQILMIAAAEVAFYNNQRMFWAANIAILGLVFLFNAEPIKEKP